MDFRLSKPQKMLQDSVKEFLTRHCSFERVRELMETETAHDPELWEGLTDQGWVALTLPEEHEGLELGAVDLVAVTEAMGSFTMPGPFLSNTWAAELIAASGNETLAKEVLPGVADGEPAGGDDTPAAGQGHGRRHRHLADAYPGARGVQDTDGLVRELAAGDVAHGQTH